MTGVAPIAMIGCRRHRRRSGQADVDEEAHRNRRSRDGAETEGIAVSKPSRLSSAATAKFNVPKKSLEHHIKEKEGEMFQTARAGSSA